MRCKYCGKVIWPWQKSQSMDVFGENPRHYHFSCLFHKLYCQLSNAAEVGLRDKDIDKNLKLLFDLVKAI